MADINPTDREPDFVAPAVEDRQVQWAVLAFLLDVYPDRLTIPELSRAINAGPAEFEQEDAVECGVRELVGIGLLHVQGGFVVPTRPALHFWRLEKN